MPIKIDSTNGSITVTAEDGSGNVGLELPRAGFLSADGNGANLTNVLTLSGGAMTGAITTNSTFDGVDIATRDGVLSTTVTTANAALPKAGGAMTGAITTNSTFDGRNVSTDGTKLDGIEASADVTDATNVAAAGALMDSEVTNLASVKAFDTTDYATSTQGTTADAALPKAGGAMTGAITTNSTFDGRDVATDGTKLDGIETSATADQTAAQIKTHLENGIDSIHYVDGSIDTDHIADDAVTADKLANSLNTAIASAATTGKAIAMAIVFG